MDGNGRIEWLVPLNTGCVFVDADTTAGTNWTRVQPGTSAGITLEGQANRLMGIMAWDRSRSLFTRVSVPTSIGGPSGVTWSRNEFRLADVNGDGLPDLLDALLSNSDHWNVSIARKVVRSPTLDPQIDYQARRVGEDLGVIHVPMVGLPSKENATFSPTSFRVLDENGDGRAELVQIDNAGERRSFGFMNDADTIVYHHRKEHSPEATSTSSTSSYGPALPNWGTPNFGGVCCGNEPGYWFPVDVNGDGLKDVLYETSSAAGSAFRLRINTGRGYGPPLEVGGAATALSQYPKDHFFNASVGGAATVRGRDTGLRVADMNYDGRDDLVLLDPLLETQAPPAHGSGYQVATADFRIAYSNGSGFNAPVTISGGGYERLYRRHEGFMVQFGDVNGDGLSEMLEMVAVPGDATKRKLVVFRRQVAVGGLDVIRAVADERGDAEAVSYDNMSAGTAKRFVSSTTPDTHVSDLSAPSPTSICVYPASCVAKGSVVKQYENFRSERQIRNVYRYFGAHSDVTGRGWLGFARTTMHDTVTNFLFKSNFDLLPLQGVVSGENGPAYHIYPRAGMPIEKTVTYSTGTSPASDLSVPENWHFRATTDTLIFSGYPVRLVNAVKLTRVEEFGTLMRLYDTTTEYDDFGNPRIVTSRGSTVNSIVSADTHEVTTTNYDNITSSWLIGLPKKVVETTKTKDDAFGTGCVGTDAAPCATSTRTTDYEYYPNGLLKKIIREPGAAANSGLKLTTEFMRDTAGLVTSANEIPSETGAVTRTERTVFDESGANVIEESNALGHKTWFLYQPKTRWRYATADQNGPSDKADVLLIHDNMGRVRERRQADGAVETIDYGFGVERRAVADGPSSATFFDARRRPTLQTWTAFTTDTSGVAETVYNSLGKVVKTQYREVAQPHATLSASEASARSGLSGAFQRSAASYDAMARLRTSTNGLSEVTTFTYPSPIGSTTSVDPSGYIRKTFTDHAGRTRWLKQTLTGPQTRELFTAYGYDDRGELAHVKTPDGARDVMQRDRLGRLLERRQYVAGGSGNVLNRRVTYTSFDEIATEAHGGSGTGTTVVSLLRDGLGRVTERKDAGASSGAEIQSFVWDPAGALGQLRRASTTGAAGSYQHTALYGYDVLGRLSEKREVFPNAGPDEVLSFGYTYDGRGRIDTVRYPETSATDSFSHPATGGLTLKYAYQNGQLKTIRDQARPVSEQPIWQVSAREAYGEFKAGVFWNQRTLGRVLARDPNTLRLSSSVLYTTSGTPITAVQEFAYQANGLLSEREVNNTLRENYVYDTVSRLLTYDRRNTAVTNTQRISATFQYDDVGNIKIVDTTASEGSPDWPNVDEQYTLEPTVPNFVRAHTIGGVQATYVPDDAGRVARQLAGTAAQREYTYTTFDLPRTISQPALNRTTKLAYTAHHARSRKTTTGGTSNNDVLYLGNLYEQRKTTTGSTVNGQSVFRIMGEDGMLVEIVHPWNAGSAGTRVRNLIVNDHQGSPAFSTNGSSLTTLGFLPFGKRAGAPPTTPPASAVGYTGHIQDDDLGLVNMQGRLYDVTQRRFISRDPLVETAFHSGGLNPYAYALNNPLNRLDPNGFQSHECGGPDTTGQGAGSGDTGGGDRSISINMDGGSGGASSGGGSEGAGNEGADSQGGGSEASGSQGGGSEQSQGGPSYEWGDTASMPDMSHIPESEMDEVVITLSDNGSGIPAASGTEWGVGPGGTGMAPDSQPSHDGSGGTPEAPTFNLQLSYDITATLLPGYGGQLSIGIVLGTRGANGVFTYGHGYALGGNFGGYFNTGWSATAYLTDNIEATQPVMADMGKWAVTVPVNPDSGPQGFGIGLGVPSLGAYVATPGNTTTHMAPLGQILPQGGPYTAPGGMTFFPP